jgi:hypothetical protein
MKQLDRDWMWYKLWGRYAWNVHRDRNAEIDYWNGQVGDFYGMDAANAGNIRVAYEESGEIAPKLLRRFGITEGNRQTLLLGMFASQLVNPYKYTIWPGFYESCGPEGEKLIEYVEKEWKKEPHVGELPLDIVAQAIAHGDAAVAAIEKAAPYVKKNKEEFDRLKNDMYCYREFAYAFNYKVKAAQHVLNYQWGKDIAELDAAVPLLQQSLDHYTKLVELTKDTYLYANSMQTAQRRIPVGGDDGKNKTWIELLPQYQAELTNLKENIKTLKEVASGTHKADKDKVSALKPAKVTILNGLKTVKLAEGVALFSNLPDSKIDAMAPELKGLQTFTFDGDKQRNDATTIEFETAKPVTMLVAYYRDDHRKYAKAPKLETDASANDYGQAEPVLTNALHMANLPIANIHAYSFPAGKHKLMLPKGYLSVLGFTNDKVTTRNAAIGGTDEAVDWLFY